MINLELIKEAATPGTRPTKERRWWEPHETQYVKQVVKPGDLCLDIGAKAGWYTALFAFLTGPDGRVVAFEPLPNHYAGLEKVAEQLELDYDIASVITKELALSDKQEVKEVIVQGNRGFTLIAPEDEEGGENKPSFTIDFAPLDAVFRPYIDGEKDLKGGINFIKADIDGHEVKFLRGAKKTIEHFQPLMMIEFGWPCKAVIGDDLNEAVDILQELGYSFRSVKGMELIPDPKARNPFPIRVGSGINVVCTPKGKKFPSDLKLL